MKCLLKNRVEEFRVFKGINKSQLAMKLGRCRAYVTRLERGEINPSAEVMLRLARYFKRPVEEVFQLPEDVCKTGNQMFPKSNFPFGSATNGNRFNNAEIRKINQ